MSYQLVLKAINKNVEEEKLEETFNKELILESITGEDYLDLFYNVELNTSLTKLDEIKIMEIINYYKRIIKENKQTLKNSKYTLRAYKITLKELLDNENLNSDEILNNIQENIDSLTDYTHSFEEDSIKRNEFTLRNLWHIRELMFNNKDNYNFYYCVKSY